jgi:hypothetical protein
LAASSVPSTATSSAPSSYGFSSFSSFFTCFVGSGFLVSTTFFPSVSDSSSSLTFFYVGGGTFPSKN